MALVTDSSNHLDNQQDNDTILPSTIVPSNEWNSEEKIEETGITTESEETDIPTGETNDESPDVEGTDHSTNMITAEASFTEATSADLPLGASRSSIARILVKPGQIFRVQVDNEVKEVHGKFILIDEIKREIFY